VKHPPPRVEPADVRAAKRFERFDNCARCNRVALPRFDYHGNPVCSRCLDELRARVEQREAKRAEA
jgi:uncharacterized paraquat-inducible protein A